MLRVLIGTGALLMLLGFGAAGWQYWSMLPPGEAASATDAGKVRQEGAGLEGATQSWLISPSGGMVPRADVRAFLARTTFVPDRSVMVTQTAALDALLAEGEKLPATPYLQVLADIRAPRIAQDLCPMLIATLAEACAIQSARVVEGSVDPVAGTAVFRIELVYRQRPGAEPLPDLAAHVLRTEALEPFSVPVAALDQTESPEPGTEPKPAPVFPASAEMALGEVLAAVATACGDEDRAPTCRLLRVSLDWAPGEMPKARAEVAWLAPLPEGMSAVAPLESLPEG